MRQFTVYIGNTGKGWLAGYWDGQKPDFVENLALYTIHGTRELRTKAGEYIQELLRELEDKTWEEGQPFLPVSLV